MGSGLRLLQFAGSERAGRAGSSCCVTSMFSVETPRLEIVDQGAPPVASGPPPIPSLPPSHVHEPSQGRTAKESADEQVLATELSAVMNRPVTRDRVVRTEPPAHVGLSPTPEVALEPAARPSMLEGPVPPPLPLPDASPGDDDAGDADGASVAPVSPWLQKQRVAWRNVATATFAWLVTFSAVAALVIVASFGFLGAERVEALFMELAELTFDIVAVAVKWMTGLREG